MAGTNDAVHWRTDLGGGTSVALIQAGSFRSDAGTLLGPVPWILWRSWAEDELDENRRLLQALNCLLIETPAGRVLVETGIGERMDAKNTTMRGYTGSPVVPAMLNAGFDPASVDIVAMSHLHYDHAGGLLLADGTRAFPRARIVAQRAEWEIALGDNSRVVASYDQPELRLVADWGAEGWAEGDTGERAPAVQLLFRDAVAERSSAGESRGARRTWRFEFPIDAVGADDLVRVEAVSDRGLARILVMGTLRPYLPATTTP